MSKLKSPATHLMMYNRGSLDHKQTAFVIFPAFFSVFSEVRSY